MMLEAGLGLIALIIALILGVCLIDSSQCLGSEKGLGGIQSFSQEFKLLLDKAAGSCPMATILEYVHHVSYSRNKSCPEWLR